MTDATNSKKVWTMEPSAAAIFLRENFSVPDQLAVLQEMLEAGGHVSNLAHGIAIELDIDEHQELQTALVTSLKMKQSDMSVGYGGQVGESASQRSEFAGKGPMFAKMGSSDPGDAETLVKSNQSSSAED